MQQYPNWRPQEPESHNDLKALIFGVVSFLFCRLPVVTILTGIIALVYANRARKQPYHNFGMTIAGLVLGIIGILVGMVFTVYWGFYFLHILRMLYEENKMVPAPHTPDFFEGPGTPAVLLGFRSRFF